MNITIDWRLARKILTVYWCLKTRKFLIVNLIDNKYKVVDYYIIDQEKSCFPLNYHEVSASDINSEYQLEEIVLSGEFFDLEFNSEEEALYFKIKYCI